MVLGVWPTYLNVLQQFKQLTAMKQNHGAVITWANLYTITSPVLAALRDPLCHAGVESLSAHMTVLTIGVQQPPQGHKSVLPGTLCRHAVQVMNYGGGQNLPWRKTRCRNNVRRACTTVEICRVRLNKHNTVHLCWHGYKRCTWCRGVHVLRIRLSHPRPLFQDLGTPRLHGRKSKLCGSFMFGRYESKQINDKGLPHWPSLLSDIVLFSSEFSAVSSFYMTWYLKDKNKTPTN